MATQSQMILRFPQPSPPKTSSPFVQIIRLRTDGSPHQQYLNKLRECFQLVSERERERVVVDGKTIAFVVSCDIAERFPLSSFLHFLQSAEIAHPVDAGPTVTRLVHGHAAEPRRNGRCVEHICCCKVIKFQIRSSTSPALRRARNLLTH